MRTVSSAPSTGKCKKVQVRNLLIEVLRPEVGIVIVGLKPTGSHRDQRGRRDDLLRLDVVDFNVFSALQARQVDLVVEVFEVSNERIVLQLQNTMMMLRSPVEETKEVGLRHD